MPVSESWLPCDLVFLWKYRRWMSPPRTSSCAMLILSMYIDPHGQTPKVRMYAIQHQFEVLSVLPCNTNQNKSCFVFIIVYSECTQCIQIETRVSIVTPLSPVKMYSYAYLWSSVIQYMHITCIDQMSDEHFPVPITLLCGAADFLSSPENTRTSSSVCLYLVLPE